MFTKFWAAVSEEEFKLDFKHTAKFIFLFYLRLLPIDFILKPMKMQKLNFIPIIIALFAFELFASATLLMFNARSEGYNIILSWQTAQENGLMEFIIQRRTIDGSFFDISRVKARGDNSFYSYVDEDVFSKENNLFVYRLKMINYDPNIPPVYSEEVTVSHNVSSVKRTWGSIKALFR